MRLTEHLHLIGSGRFGFASSDDYDSNIYLVDGGSELAVIDTGAGRTRDALASLIVAAGFDPARVSAVLLTHQHADHAGSAGDFQRSTGAKVIASAAAADAVRDADAFNRRLDRARRAGDYPPDYRFTGIPDVTPVSAGDTVHVGQISITAVDTTGHCSGHLAYTLNDGASVCAFTGDALLPGGEIVIQPTADLSLPDSITALRRLAAIRFDVLLPGHGCPALRGGYRHAHVAVLEAERGGLPPAFRTPPLAATDPAEHQGTFR